jgi:CheY-like chemotaxis protein
MEMFGTEQPGRSLGSSRGPSLGASLGPLRSVAPSKRAPTIAIADDDAELREACAALFASDGCSVVAFPDGTALVRHLAACAQDDELPDAIVVDHLMPGFSGLQICEALFQVDWPMPVVLLTAFGDVVGRLAHGFGAHIVEKPCRPRELCAVVYGSIADDWEERTCAPCASCGSGARVRLDRDLGVAMCGSCAERAGPPDGDDELGVVD